MNKNKINLKDISLQKVTTPPFHINLWTFVLDTIAVSFLVSFFITLKFRLLLGSIAFFILSYLEHTK